MSVIFEKKPERKKILKELIKRLHAGENPEKIKEEFRKLLKEVSPEEVAKIEEELIKEGLPVEEIRRLCDIHLSLFKEGLERKKTSTSEAHPVSILMKEHEIMLEMGQKLKKLAEEVKNYSSFDDAEGILSEIESIVEKFRKAENHYLREENVLFPYLEKHGITQPPAIMWMEHDQIRAIKKELFAAVKEKKDPSSFGGRLLKIATTLHDMINSHFFKENNVLFPTGMKVISEEEWKEIRKEFDELGYFAFEPPPLEERDEKETVVEAGKISFETGNLTKEEIEAIFNALPFDITFVDKDDIVRFFSLTKERIFVRTKAVIGRTVQQCHPQKSIHLVNKILEEFKAGKRDVAEFWINLQGRLIYIRYFPVRNKKGEYLGCLEVTQDITDIQKIKGEKRLL